MGYPVFDEIWRKGGNFHYAFHVHGYPWCACTSQALVDALNDGGNVLARRYIFGTSYIDIAAVNTYFSDTNAICPAFNTLQTPGPHSVKLDEGTGKLTGTYSKIEIEDRDLGWDWYHSPTDIAGLEGVHRIAQLYRTAGDIGFGQLRSNDLERYHFRRDDQYMYIKELSPGGIMFDWLDAQITATDYSFVWIGQECVAIQGITDLGSDILKLEVASDGTNFHTGRGCFRSREQDHWCDAYGSNNPIVSVVPQSIIDKPCTLWAVDLVNDNTDILHFPVRYQPGTVSNRVETRKGITRISCKFALDALDHEIDVPQWGGAHLEHYIFSRYDNGLSGADSVTNWSTAIIPFGEAPHLVIREFTTIDDHTGTLYPVWLCAKGETVTFHTVDEIYDALNTELAKISSADATYNQTQLSGEADDWVDTGWSYRVQDGIVTQYHPDGTAIARNAWISGPLTWLFGMGIIKTGSGSTVNYIWRQLRNERIVQPFYASFIYGEYKTLYYVGGNVVYPTLFQWCDSDPEPPNDYVGYKFLKGSAYEARYVYQWQWDADDYKRWKPAHLEGAWEGWESGKSANFKLPDSAEYDPDDAALFLRKETVIDDFVAGGTFQMGKPGSHRYCQLDPDTIDITGLGTWPAMRGFVNELLTTPDDAPDDAFHIGQAIYYIEYAELHDVPIEDLEELTTPDGQGFFRANDSVDPWPITQKYTGYCDTLVGVFRGLIGSTDADDLQLTDYNQATQLVGFLDEGNDHYSCIDWDYIEDHMKKIEGVNQQYKLTMTEGLNLLDMLINEMLLHGYYPTWEWVATKGMFRMRCRKMGYPNFSIANSSGRIFDTTNIEQGEVPTEAHNDTWLFNRIEAKLNYVDDEPKLTIPIDYKSGHTQNRNSAKVLKIKSNISWFPQSTTHTDAVVNAMTNHFVGGMLKFIANPAPVNKTKGTIAAALDLAVGRECIVTDPSARTPYTHEVGVTDLPAIVTSMKIDLDKGNTKITYRMDDGHSYGYAPAVLVEADNSTKDVSKITVSASVLHAFSAATDRTDASYLDCYNWSESSGDGTYWARACSCGDYAVIAFETGTDSPTLMELTVQALDPAAGTFQLWGTTTNWDITKEHVIIFDTWDNIEACQSLWLYGADALGTLGAGNDAGMRWK